MKNLKLEREAKKTELNGRSPLGRRRSVLDRRAIEDEEEDSKCSV
jgi:hypothetical protein